MNFDIEASQRMADANLVCGCLMIPGDDDDEEEDDDVEEEDEGDDDDEEDVSVMAC